VARAWLARRAAESPDRRAGYPGERALAAAADTRSQAPQPLRGRPEAAAMLPMPTRSTRPRTRHGWWAGSLRLQPARSVEEGSVDERAIVATDSAEPQLDVDQALIRPELIG
jgi:hypothetical protein